MILFTGNKL